MIRADASESIGAGHVMRTLSLAEELVRHGADVEFVCRKATGHLAAVIEDRNIALSWLSPVRLDSTDSANISNWLSVPWQQDAMETAAVIEGRACDWLIVDNYGIEAKWHQALRPKVSRIMVIDDLADRKLDCDFLLDQTFQRSSEDYQVLVPDHCRMFLGSEFALLRNEFINSRKKALERRQNYREINRIFVSLGGGNTCRLNLQVLAALESCDGIDNMTVDLVVSSTANDIELLQDSAQSCKLKTNIIVDAKNMSELMFDADLAIGAAGSTAWERCCMGLPTLMLVLADNQRLIGEKLGRAGAVEIISRQNIGRDLCTAINRLNSSPGSYQSMWQSAARICEGDGVLRIAKELTR
ncbi:MAG: UDP-2,4-diacetamido-2,4,6-trideoxy-beta-L-altropyranose hydrolase [Pseudomonadota bacterium]